MPGPIAAKPTARAAAITEAAEINGSMMIFLFLKLTKKQQVRK
jgi:hypothetical protein